MALKEFWIGRAEAGSTIILGHQGINSDLNVPFSIYFNVYRENDTDEEVQISASKISYFIDSAVDMNTTSEITMTIKYNNNISTNSIRVKPTGVTKKAKSKYTIEPNNAVVKVPNKGEDISVIVSITISNTNPKYSNIKNNEVTFSQNLNRIPSYTLPTTPITGKIEITSPSDGKKFPPSGSFLLKWTHLTNGINNYPLYTLYKNKGTSNQESYVISRDDSYYLCYAPSSSNVQDIYQIIAKDNKYNKEFKSNSITVGAYSGSEPSLSLTSSSSTYGTSGGTITLTATYSGGSGFGRGTIDLPSGVTYNGSNSIIVNPGTRDYNINIAQNIPSFSLKIVSYYSNDTSWSAESSALNLRLVRIAPNINSISVIPSYTNNSTVELYGSEKLGRIFKTNAIIYGEDTEPLSCITKWYIAHSTNKTTVNNASYNTSNISYNLTNNLSNSNINVNSIVSEGEYFKFILYAENDNQIRTKDSEIFYFPYAPLAPTNFKCINIKGENVTTNNSATLTITTQANFTWTLNNRSSSNNQRLSYKSIRLEYSSKNNANGIYSNWSNYGTYSPTTNSTEKNTDTLTKGYFYGFRIVAEDLEGITSTSDYINTFRSLGPYITNLNINLQSNYNDFTAYKPLSRIDNSYYNVSISNNKGNLENDGLTYKVYGRYGTQDTLLFTYTCIESTTDDKGFILNGNNITFSGNNDTVIANLSGQIIKDYITSRNITNKNTRYTNFSFYITIEDGYGETVSFNQPFNVDYREAPTWPSGINFPIGINYNINNSTAYEKMLTTTSSSNDRMINFKEKIRFKFPVMEDLNRTGSEAVDNDVNKYRISVARLNVKPSENPELNDSTKYSQYNFSLLREVAKSSLTNKQVINGKNYYIYDFEFPQYTVNYFLVFKLEGIDTQGLVSTPIYSNTYLVGCRVQPPVVNLTSLETDTIEKEGKTYFNKLTLSCNIIDNGGSKFSNSSYSYSDYNNLERIIKGEDKYSIKLTLHISKTPDFINYNTKEIILSTYTGSHTPYDSLNLNTIEFKVSDLLIERTDQMKLYVRAILDYPLGYTNVDNGTFYNISSEASLKNISQTLTYFTEAPTVSYRKNRIGINTNTFEDNDLVAIVESTGKNIIRIVGSNEAGTEKFTITLNLKTREVDGIIVDGGSW